MLIFFASLVRRACSAALIVTVLLLAICARFCRFILYLNLRLHFPLRENGRSIELLHLVNYVILERLHALLAALGLERVNDHRLSNLLDLDGLH